MKINIAIFILFALLSTYLFAQQEVEVAEKNTEKGIKLNFNAGFHFSNMIGQNVQKYDNIHISAHSYGSTYRYECNELYAGGYITFLPGFKFGLGLTFDKTKKFSWGFDLNFETKGCLIPIKEITIVSYTSQVESKSINASNLNSKIRLNYIVIPVRTEFKYKKFYLMPGVYTGFLLGAFSTTKFDYENHRFNVQRRVSSHYSLIDLGVILNIGFCFPLPKNEFIKIGIVGEWNINGTKSRSLDGGSYSYFCNQVLGLELKYEFKIKK